MNDFSVVGDACYAHKIMGSPGGKHWESLQRNVWRSVVSPLKRSVFGHRMLHSAVILWEALVTNVGALKFQVSVWLMRKITSINTSCLRLSVKFIFTEFTQWSTWRKGLEIYSANLGINVGAHLSFLVVIKCGDIYTKCNYTRPRSALCVQVVTRQQYI